MTTEITTDRTIKEGMQRLVDAISSRWPEDVMAPVRDDMRYGQYAEALLNIIAIGVKNSLSLGAEEKKDVTNLIAAMKIERDVAGLYEYLGTIPQGWKLSGPHRTMAMN